MARPYTGNPGGDYVSWPANEPSWTTEELQRDFRVITFAAPYVVVVRKSDGVKGLLEFTHSPRVYFGFKATS